MPEFLRDPEFWILVSAAALLCVLWKPLKRSLLGALDARAERIGAELDEAKKLREEAERALADYQKKERDAIAEAEAILAHARAEAERGAEQAARGLEEALLRRRRLAEERIAQAEARAVSEIRAVAVDLAIAAAREMMVRSLGEARGAALIDGAIAALPTQLQ
jgi:F-type H+-transporting ATPase subunit b